MSEELQMLVGMIQDEHDPSPERKALEKIALLDEADGHELTARHAHEAVAIATAALGKHPSEILASRLASRADGGPIKNALHEIVTSGEHTPDGGWKVSAEVYQLAYDADLFSDEQILKG